jgi:hypothetical protein
MRKIVTLAIVIAMISPVFASSITSTFAGTDPSVEPSFDTIAYAALIPSIITTNSGTIAQQTYNSLIIQGATHLQAQNGAIAADFQSGFDDNYYSGLVLSTDVVSNIVWMSDFNDENYYGFDLYNLKSNDDSLDGNFGFGIAR